MAHSPKWLRFGSLARATAFAYPAIARALGQSRATGRKYLMATVAAGLYLPDGQTAVAVYVILDLEFPRLGFIRVDAFDQALVELRASMN
jgi:hypothetical protein